jgi:hypothetical protein
VLRWLIALGLAGMGLMAYGLIALVAWPTVFGAVGLVVAQLWRIDRFSLLFEQHQRPPLSPAESDTTEGEQSSRRGRSDGLGWNREV